MNCYRQFNVDNSKLNLSAMDQARKLTFSDYIRPPCIFKQYIAILSRVSDSVQCRRGLHF